MNLLTFEITLALAAGASVRDAWAQNLMEMPFLPLCVCPGLLLVWSGEQDRPHH